MTNDFLTQKTFDQLEGLVYTKKGNKRDLASIVASRQFLNIRHLHMNPYEDTNAEKIMALVHEELQFEEITQILKGGKIMVNNKKNKKQPKTDTPNTVTTTDAGQEVITGLAKEIENASNDQVFLITEPRKFKKSDNVTVEVGTDEEESTDIDTIDSVEENPTTDNEDVVEVDGEKVEIVDSSVAEEIPSISTEEFHEAIQLIVGEMMGDVGAQFSTKSFVVDGKHISGGDFAQLILTEMLTKLSPPKTEVETPATGTGSVPQREPVVRPMELSLVPVESRGYEPPKRMSRAELKALGESRAHFVMYGSNQNRA